MRTLSKVFAAAFAALGVVALGAVVSGATHQIAMAGICCVMALVMKADADGKQ